MSAKLGADYFVIASEKIQTNVITPFYLTIVIPSTQQFARPVDRKLGVISYTKTLADSAAFGKRFQKGWGYTCNNLLELLKNAPKVTTGVGDDLVAEADVDDIGFGIGFTPLNTCKRAPRDEFPEIGDVNQWVGQFLKEANARLGGQVVQYAQERLTPEAQQALASYLS